jgi:hypothetical protein
MYVIYVDYRKAAAAQIPFQLGIGLARAFKIDEEGARPVTLVDLFGSRVHQLI